MYNPTAVVTHWANLADITFDNAAAPGMGQPRGMAGVEGLDDTIPGGGAAGDELSKANQVSLEIMKTRLKGRR